MGNINQKNGVFHVRFRFRGQQFKKSLKTRDREAARAGQNLVEHTIYRLTTGQLRIPPGIDPGDFIVSGGTITEASSRAHPISLEQLVNRYLSSRIGKATSTVYTERIHLGNLQKALLEKPRRTCDQITHLDLKRYLEQRARECTGTTANKERMTIMQLDGHCVFPIPNGSKSI